MSLRKKLNTAMGIVREKGLPGAWHVLRQKVRALGSTNESELVFKLLKETTSHGVMCDVGAHHGHCLLPFAETGWQVYAFEPDPKNRARLQETTHKFQNVHVDARAVSDQVLETASFFTSSESDGVSGLSAFLPTHTETCTVCTTTLSEFFAEMNLDKVDFLKIDTEGFDLMVLQGLPWQSVRPAVILCEFEDAKTLPLGYSYKTLADFLVEKGYQVVVSEWRPIVRYGEQHAWRGYYTYPHEMHEQNAWGNLVATNDDALYKRLLKASKAKNGAH